MAYRSRGHRKGAARTNLHQTITDRIIAELEAGSVPWVQPWASAAAPVGIPFNIVSGRKYSGINVLTLWHAMASRGLSGQGFLTFRQARSLGGTVRRGEQGTDIIYTHRVATRDERLCAQHEGREPVASVPFLRHFTVFSVDQCDGLPSEFTSSQRAPDTSLIIPAAEALIQETGADFRIGGTQAFYDPLHDFVQVPCPADFFEPIDWHRTAFHELSHWTGHRSRLDRNQAETFGTDAYAREELVAELSGAFLCAELGIVPTVRHSDYIGAWLALMREDNKAVLKAASAASRAAGHILAFRPVLATAQRQRRAGSRSSAVDGAVS
ncbi:ArdC family protein [Sphingomonas sp. C3-2]|uniref:ArdC family protein n=1 Tax=Sphingomonas sp. C3-2 TaxID=3062169 RepID=UPI00294B01AF|nr:zincin-like metallopeptidase domain-containing protein [Sphingomonas sp. C3-2]WOK36178.1 zincin-like metallopeptidase domain-containing protein [Sphingomonas sp. C3-2]